MRSKVVLIVLVLGFAVSIGISIPRASSSDHLTTNAVQAQEDAPQCGEVVVQALEVVAANCAGLGANEICYGNDFISATLNTDVFFDRPGDIVPVTAVDELVTGNLDLGTGDWGVALMDVQADLPEANGSVRILLFGGTQLEPTTPVLEDLPFCTFSNTSASNLSLRSAPLESARAYDVLGFNQSLRVYGQSSDGAWLRSSRGWVAAEAGDLACGSLVLPVMDSNADTFGAPMQSFALRVDEAAQCESVPSGLLIQTPSGQTANLLINNVEVRVGSTALFTLDSDESGCQYLSNHNGNIAVGDVGVDGDESRVPPGAMFTFGDGCVEAGESPLQPIADDAGAFVEELTVDLQSSGLDFVVADAPAYVSTAPTLSATVTADEIIAGQCTYLNWTSQAAAAVLVDGVPYALDSTIQVCPTESTDYVLIAETLDPAFESATTTLSVTVTEADGELIPAAPTLTVSVLPEVIDFGACAILSWTATDAQAVELDFASVGLAGELEVCPEETTSYALSALPAWPDFSVITASTVLEVLPPLDLGPTPTPTITFTPSVTPTLLPTLTPTPTLDCAEPDTIGDPCDFDEDGDGVDDIVDNCPFDANLYQEDADGDGIGDVCDPVFNDLLQTSVTVSNSTPPAGTIVNFVITVTNVGLVNATNVDVSVAEDLIDCTGVGGAFNPSWVIPLLGPGASQVYNFPQNSGTNCSYKYTVSAYADEPEGPTGNNLASASYSTVGNDLSASGGLSNSAPFIGDVITFNFSVTNSGPGTANNVGYTVTGNFNLCAGGSAVVPGPSSSGNTVGAGGSINGSWNIDTGTYCSGSASVSVTSNPLPTDPDSGDLTASASFSGILLDLGTSATVSNSSPAIGDTITADLTISNTNPSVTAQGVTYQIVISGVTPGGGACSSISAANTVINGGPVDIGPMGSTTIPVNIDTNTYCAGVASIAVTGISTPPIEGGPSSNSAQVAFQSTFP